jgi:peroxiredoxin
MSELQGLQLSISEFREQGASIAGICVDSVDDNRKVVERLGLEFPILSDPERAALRAFDVVHAAAHPLDGSDMARPATFIVDGGVVQWRDLTEDYRIRPRPETLLEVLRARRSGAPARMR